MRTYVLTPHQARMMSPLEREQLFDWLRTFGVDPEDVTGIRLIPTARKVVLTTLVRDDKRQLMVSPYDAKKAWVENMTYVMKDKPPLIDHYTIEDMS